MRQDRQGPVVQEHDVQSQLWSFPVISPTSDAVDSNTAPLHHYFQLADPDVYLTTQQVEGKDESTFHQLNTPAYYHDMEPSTSSKIDQLSDHNYSHRCSDVKVHGGVYMSSPCLRVEIKRTKDD